jgi:hypothetical protein
MTIFFYEIELGLIITMIGAAGFMITIGLVAHSNKYNLEHAIVECKNLSTKTNINQIQKTNLNSP